jgi:hypothetical protein
VKGQESSAFTYARGRFQPTKPQTFQVGDIVEVQVSFIAIPIRDNKWKISTILRSVNLFNGSFTQVLRIPFSPLPTIMYNFMIQEAFVRGAMHRTTSDERPKISLKRKVGYFYEQVSATRARMAEMHIDAQSEGPQKESENMANELD